MLALLPGQLSPELQPGAVQPALALPCRAKLSQVAKLSPERERITTCRSALQLCRPLILGRCTIPAASNEMESRNTCCRSAVCSRLRKRCPWAATSGTARLHGCVSARQAASGPKVGHTFGIWLPNRSACMLWQALSGAAGLS